MKGGPRTGNTRRTFAFGEFIRSWTKGRVGAPGVPILQAQADRGLVAGDIDDVLAAAMNGCACNVIMDFVSLQFAVLCTHGSTCPPVEFDVGQVSGRGTYTWVGSSLGPVT